MTAIRVARKPSATPSKAAKVGLLVAFTMNAPVSGVQSLSTEELQKMVAPSAKPSRTPAKHSHSSQKKGMSKGQTRAVEKVLKWVKSVHPTERRQFMQAVATSLPGGIRGLAEIDDFMKQLNTAECSSLSGLPQSVGEVASAIISQSQATHYANDFGNPKDLNSLGPKLKIHNWNTLLSVTESCSNRISNLPTLQRLVAKAESKDVRAAPAFNSLQEEMSRHFVHFLANKRVEDARNARRRDRGMSPDSLNEVLTQLSGQRSSSMYTSPKSRKEISSRKWGAMVNMIIKGFRNKQISRNRIGDFTSKQAENWVIHNQQKDVLTGLGAIMKTWATALNAKDCVTHEAARAKKMYEPMYEYSMFTVANRVKEIGRANFSGALFNKFEEWLGNTEVPASNPVHTLGQHLTTANEMKSEFEGKLCLENLMMAEPSAVLDMVKPNEAENAQFTVGEWLKNKKIEYMAPDHARNHNVTFKPLSATDPWFKMLELHITNSIASISA